MMEALGENQRADEQQHGREHDTSHHDYLSPFLGWKMSFYP
jgi:hypothetical protein